MQYGGLEVFNLLIKYDADVNLQDNQGNTPLHYSFNIGLSGYLAIIQSAKKEEFTKILIENGADPNIKNDYGISPFDIVREKGLQHLITLFEEAVERQAQKGANPTPLNNTLLHSVENIEEAKLLIINGADVNAKNRDNQTPLHIASKKGYEEIAKLLLENDADVNARENTGAWTPLHIASYKRHEKIVKLLLENDADVNARDNFGKTALHFVSWDNVEIVKLLLEHHAYVDMRDDRGKTPHRITNRRDNQEIINLLEKAWQKQREEPNPIPLNNTLLHLVDNIEDAKLLIENGADVNAKNRENETPLHKTVWRGNIEIVKLFIENDADLNAREREEGVSPLLIASRNGQLEIVKILLDAGADVHILNWSNKPITYYHVGSELSSLEKEEQKTRLETIEKLLEDAIQK